ncbi:hypothetical protein [Vibrio sp. Of7-15]|nr:hypothetical protein [Vibrio sp. Of7-15]
MSTPECERLVCVEQLATDYSGQPLLAGALSQSTTASANVFL